MSDNIEKLSEALSSLTVLELADLSKKLEEKWGVSALSFSTPVSTSNSGATEELKDKFEVVLVSIGENKINVIKEVRAITGLGLKEAKDLVEAAPKTVKSDVSNSEADEIKKKLESVGAKVDLR